MDELERGQTVGEEIANSISHGLGFVALLCATPLLIARAARMGEPAYVVGVSIFASSGLVLYLASTLYHALPNGNAKRVFRVIEHSAIFVLIAGTYTPFMLGVLHGVWGWTLAALIWALALLGVLLKTMAKGTHATLSLSLYIGMGWLLVVAIRPVWLHVPHAGVGWIVAGGIAYTAGTAFFVAERLPYAHFVWHLFVLAGTACHFTAVWFYAA